MPHESLTDKIKVGIAGLGRAGRSNHYETLRKHPKFLITAVADPDAARTSQANQEIGCRCFRSVDEMVAARCCDLIVIATPSHFHHEEATAVLSGGISCILEKPMASDYAEARELAELAENKGVHLFVHHQALFYDEYNHMREVLEEGILGELFQIRVFWGFFKRRWDWQTLKKNGGGQLNNTCPHAISVVLPLLGDRVTSVFSSLRHINDAGDAEDHVQLMLETESGLTADITVTSVCAHTLPRFMLLGSSGTLSTDGQQSQIKYFDATQVPVLKALENAAPLDTTFAETLPWIETTRPTKPTRSPGSFHDNVADVILHGAEPVVTAASAVEVMRVIEMCHRAAEKNQPSLLQPC